MKQFILFAVIQIQLAWTKITLTDAEVKFNDNYNMLNVSVTHNENGDSIFNLKNDNFKVLQAFQLKISFSYSQKFDNEDYQQELMKSTLNACKTAGSSMANFIIKIIMDKFAKHSDFELKCPFQKKTYKIIDLKIGSDIEKFIPSFMLRNGSFMLQVDAKGKVAGAKFLTNLYTIKIHGKQNV